MKHYSIIITIALVIAIFLLLDDSSKDEIKLIELKNKKLDLENRNLSLSIDSLDIEIKKRNEIVESLHDRVESIEKEKKTIRIGHENTRKPFYTAADTGLAIIITGQRPPKGY